MFDNEDTGLPKIKIPSWHSSGRPMTTTYQVASYEGEDSLFWLFRLEPISVEFSGFKRSLSGFKPIFYCFPKRKKDKAEKPPVYYDAETPSFIYHFVPDYERDKDNTEPSHGALAEVVDNDGNLFE